MTLKIPAVFSLSEFSIWWRGQTGRLIRENSRRVAFRSERPEGLRLVQGHNPTPTQVKTPLLVGSRAARSGTQGPELKAARTQTTPGQTVFQDGPTSEADRKTPTGCYFLTEAYCRLVVDEGIGRPRDSSGQPGRLLELRKAEEFPAPAAQSPVRRRVGGAGP